MLQWEPSARVLKAPTRAIIGAMTFSPLPDPRIREIRPTAGLHVEWVEDEAVVLDPASGELHYLNNPAAVAYALILEHGYDRAMTEVAGRTDAVELRKAFPELIDQMIEKGLLEIPQGKEDDEGDEN